MLKNLIILPDGTELFSGTGQTNNIRSTALTECVNSGEELTLGSVCSNMMEATIQTPRGGLSLTAGDEVTLYKVDGAGVRHKVGLFTLEKPTRPSANILKLTGYDRVARLDKDLTAWLKGLDGWPYSLLTFAGMVCKACGLTLVTKSVPNGDYQVSQFEIEATGRQLMGWIGEVCCRFCRATPTGDIELAWYQQAGVSIAPSGEHFYFQRGLSFEDYQVAPIEAVQLRLADSDDGALWPAAADGVNSYIIKSNPILMAAVTEATRTALRVIENELAGVTYTPCKVSIPATLDLHAGDIVQITDVNGVTISTYVMTKVQKGQRDTLECTGSPRRDSSTAVNNGGPAYVSASQAGVIASSKAAEETEKLNQLELLKRLTKDWVDDGIYLTGDGKLAINASAILTGILKASLIDADNLKIKAANVTGKLTAAQIDATDLKVNAANITGTLTIGQLPSDVAMTKDIPTETGIVSIVKGTVNADYINALKVTAGSVAAENITGTTLFGKIIRGGSISIGESFNVSSKGVLTCSGATINGVLSAGVGSSLGGFSVDENSIYSGTWDSNAPEVFISTGTSGYYAIGGHSTDGWVFGAGGNFGVTRWGELYCGRANVGGFDISGNTINGTNIRLHKNGHPYRGVTCYLTIWQSGSCVGGLSANGWVSA